jgi:hypothetical protein
MKVFENIDNYDFFPAYEMSEEDEERFIGDLRKIVTDLIPLRGNKRKTRQYFTKYLRLDYNIRQHEFHRTEYTLEGPVCEKYVPQPGEYDWPSDMLQQALIGVLDDDKHSFGHIVNYLNYDIADRKDPGKWYWDQISDAAVEYNLKFDFDDVQAKVDSLKSFKEKRDYLNEVNLACQTFGRLTQDEYNEFGKAFEYKLDKLIDKVKEEQEIWGDSKPAAKEAPTPESEPTDNVQLSLTPHQFKGAKLSADGIILSDVYFSPEVMATGQYSELDFELTGEETCRQQPHIKEFEQVLTSNFEKCYFEIDEVFLDKDTIASSKKLINDLFEDYASRISELFGEDYDTIRRKITEWLKATAKSITKIYLKNKAYISIDGFDGATGEPYEKEYSTAVLRDALLDQAYESYVKIGFQYFGQVDDSLKNVMPYNLWGGKYDQDFEENFGRVALSDENRAKVFRKANKEWLEKEIASYCQTYDFDVSIDLPFGGPDEPKYNPDKHIPKFLQGLFSDYVRRVNNTVRDKRISHDAFQIWVFDLMNIVNDLYHDECDRLSGCNFNTEKSQSHCQYFYVGCCLSYLMKMLLNYYSDYEEVAKLDSKTQKGTEPIEEKTIIENAVIPQPVEPQEQAVSQRKDVLGDAFCYKYDNDMLFNQLLQLMLRATEDSATTLSKELINETFDVISGEFDHFLQTTDIFTEDRINVLFMCFDHWFDTFKRLADAVFSTCQQTIRPKSRKKSDAEAARVKERKAQSMAMFIIEKAIVTVSGVKANILYNHQYFEQVFYNINGWKVETILAEMDRLEDAFGVGRERDILFSKYANIEAFYEKLVDIVRGGLLEVHGTADTMSEDKRLETFRNLLKAEVDFDLPMYIELVKMERDFSTETYHSAVSWVETTKYCLYQVLIEAERRIAEDENLSVEIDYTYFQKSNLAFIPNMFAEALVEYESITGNIEIDEKLNHLGERDEDDWDSEVPIFDPSLLGEDFITEEDLKLQPEDEPTPELNGEIAQDISGDAPLIAIVKESDLPENKKERESLLSHILIQDKKEEVIAYLKEHLDSNRPTDSIALLVAARELGITDSIPQSDAEKMFGSIAGRSTYNTYYRGNRDVNETSKKAYKAALKLKFLSPESSIE